MELLPFVVEWTGRYMAVGVDRYGLLFQPDKSFPDGLHLIKAWRKSEGLTEVDPLKVPSLMVHPARRVAAKWMTNWGSKADPPTSILNYPARCPIWYDPDRSPGRPETQALLDAIISVEPQLHR